MNTVKCFQGSMKYAHTAVEVDFLCQQLLASPIRALGLDIEWKVTFKAGQVVSYTSIGGWDFTARKQ